MKHVSATIILLRDHYQRLGLLNFDSSDKGWTPEQVLELCKMLNITQDELACLVCLNPKKMTRYMRSQSGIPPEVALHFLILKNWFLERTSGAVTQPSIPIGILQSSQSFSKQ